MKKYLKKSQKIHIRETKLDDLDFVIKTESAKDNKKNVFQWTKNEHIEIIDNKDTLHLIIEDKDNINIGYAIVAGLKSNNKSIEIRRVVINEKNRGYGSEFLKLMQEYTFEDLGYHKLWLDFFESNKRVEGLYKRNGFKKEGKLRDLYYYNNKYITMVVMSILEDEYFKNKS